MTALSPAEYELPVAVEYRITYRGSPGRLSGPPEDCYGAEPPEFEITTVRVCGVPVPFNALPAATQRAIEESVRDDLPAAMADEAADAAEYQAGLRRDAVALSALDHIANLSEGKP